MKDEPANIVRTIKFAQFNDPSTFQQPTVGTAPGQP